MKTRILTSALLAISTLGAIGAAPGLTGCAAEAAGGSGAPPPADSAEVTEMTAKERLAHVGLSEVRGVAYDGRPAQENADDNAGFAGKDGFDMYRVFFDSDIAASEFSALWGKGEDGKGRDDLRRFATELHANFVTLYDFNGSVRKDDSLVRSHQAFLDHAHEVGLKVSVPISNHQMKLMHAGKSDEAVANIRRTLDEIYAGGTTPHPAAGMIKIFNEPDNEGSIPEWRTLVGKATKVIVDYENEKGIPDGARLPLFSPVTDAIKEGIRGGALLGVYEGVKGEPSLGEGLWKKRFVIATNPFDQGRMMVKFATEDLPKFEKQHGMPMDTPLFFTEYGFSSQNLSDDLDAQAKYYGEQLSAIYASKDAGSVIFGAVAFSSEVRPWLASPEPGFGMLDFGGDTGGWNLPERNYDVKVKYWNPNGDSGKGQVWDGVYHVQRQTPRPVWKTVATSFTAREGK